ncbi:MAG: cation-translocating P-type ATPase, partial [Candidatus Riflemargulisbacteria bacterium]
SEIGKIASLLESAQDKKTPLQVNLDIFGKKLAGVIILLCSLIFAINIMRGYPIGESFLFAVALAVAAIPEALSSIVTIVLAIGTQKMAKEHAIIRKLHAVESLGGVSVICSDKTGTLTQNKMVVKSVLIGIDILDADKLDINNLHHKQFLEWITLCNDSVNSNGQEIGDPTELALINMSNKYGISEHELRKTIPRISELPFDSERKLMSTLHNHTNGFTLITKGAIDVILSKTTQISQNNKVRSITADDIKDILKINQSLSQSGLRVLGLANKIIESSAALTFKEENDLIFTGLIAMEDPPRLESKDAVYACKQAGIKPVMITGDHKTTAIAIARQIGILEDDKEAIEGVDLDLINDEDFKQLVTQLSVYARVSPAHKIRIVKAWQQLGFLVAMTGDGVNDAPALKQADIGISMGKVGTEVAKESSDMILTDDNFATIVKAISNGRSIYTNIKHSIFFLLSGNMAGILAVIYTSILALPLPFTAVHLLFINLLTDSMPAIALGLESPNTSAMEESPRDVKESILTGRFVFETFLQGAIIAVSTLAAYYHGLAVSGVSLGCTMAFSTLTLSRLIHGFNCRSNYPLHKIGFFTNKYQWLAMIIGTSLLLLVLLYPPLQLIFKVSQDIPNHLLEVFGASLLPLIIIQGYKTLYDFKPFNIKFSI